MSKKGFLASLIIAIVATVSLSVYTVLSVCLPNGTNQNGKPSNPKETTISLAFRSGETVSQLTGCIENENLTFSLEEGKENPLEFVEENNTYVAKDVNSSVTAVVKNDKGAKTNYIISVYHHNNGFAADGTTPVKYSETEPFIVATKAHLEELRTKINEEDRTVETSTVSYVSLVSDIDLGGGNWMPIGIMDHEAKGITFEGNNHTIKNLTIKINGENYLDYIRTSRIDSVDAGFMELGLFGSVKGVSTFKNVKFEGAEISVAENLFTILREEPVEEAEYEMFNNISIGILAGYVSKSKVENVSTQGTIKAFGFINDECVVTLNGIGGIAGCARNVQFTNSHSDINFVETGKRGYTDDENLSKNITVFGGIVGELMAYTYYPEDHDFLVSNKNLIENCTSSLTVRTYFQNCSNIAGLVGNSQNINIKNSTVKKFKLVDPTHINDVKPLAYLTSVSGAVGFVRNAKLDSCEASQRTLFASKIENVKVENFDVDMIGGIVSGIIATAGSRTGSYDEIKIEVVDCSVSGKMVARQGAGFIDEICSDATVYFTENFTGKAVNMTISAKSANAISATLEGSVKGFAKSLGEGKTERTVFDVVFKGLQSKFVEGTNTELAYSNTYGSGFGNVKKASSSTTYPVIEDICFKYDSTSCLSFSGIVHNSYGAKIKNCDVTANVVSWNYKKVDSNDVTRNFSTTYMIAGAVANAFENTIVEGISVDIVVNKNVPADEERGFAFFGGVVARIHDNNVTVKNCSVVADVYSNHVYDRGIKVSGTNESLGKIFLAGGVVGSIQKYEGSVDPVDGLTPILSRTDADNNVLFNVVVENNTVDFSIVADFTAYEVGSLGENGHRVRAIGAVVGNVNTYMTPGDTFDMSSNVVSNYKLKADKAAFTYGYQRGSALVTLNTIGLSIENNEVSNTIGRVYGISFLLHTGSSVAFKNPETFTATFENL